MNESQLLVSRIEDLIYKSEYEDSFLGFLNEQETAIACSYLKNRGFGYSVFGGYANADRVYLSMSVDYPESSYPITALHIKSKGKKELTHRDYLGSLMGIGIKRECIGDIVIINDIEAVAFVRDDIAEYIAVELRYVGRESVIVSEFNGDKSVFSIKTEELNVIVTSMRIDNVICALINCSRSVASEFISNERVFVNHCEVKKASQLICESDVVSIRGYGKFIIGNLQGTTKRGRLILRVSRYV